MDPAKHPWDATTEGLVQFAERSRYDELAPDVIEACKLRVLDTIASAMGAYDAPLSAMARKVASRVRGDDVAHVWGSGVETTPEAAAFANGVMVRLLDISDTYLGKSRGHPSDMNSGLFAAAEAAGADGRSLIAAMVLAYDVFCSFCDAVDFNSRGWDQPVYGILGCVLGASRLMGLTREQTGNAISLALAPNMALAQSRRGELSSWKGCAGPNAARNAVFAATLAKEGFTGPTAVFEGDGGLFQATGGRFEWALPRHHRIVDTHIKGLPVCYHGQSPVWASLEMGGTLDASRIEDIQIDTYKAGVVMMGSDASRWAPTTRETADHSLPYCVAVALLDGKVVDESFADERLHDPKLAALMQKVKVREDARLSTLYPEASPGRVTIRMQSGETHTREIVYPKGHAKSPMTTGEVEAKFRDMTEPKLGRARCDALLAAVRALDEAKDVRRDLVALLRLAND